MTIVSIDQVKIGIKKFVENEIAYKATGLTKFLTFFLIPSLDREVVDMVNKVKAMPIMAEFFTPEGNVIVDELYTRATMAIEKSGKVVIDKFQLALDRDDLDKIYRYIRES